MTRPFVGNCDPSFRDGVFDLRFLGAELGRLFPGVVAPRPLAPRFIGAVFGRSMLLNRLTSDAGRREELYFQSLSDSCFGPPIANVAGTAIS